MPITSTIQQLIEELGDTKIPANDSTVLSGKAAGRRKPGKEKGASPKSARGRYTRAKKPKDMPRRPLSAYNIFFKEERARMLGGGHVSKAIPLGDDDSAEASGKVSFETMAKTIGKKWKELPAPNLERFKDLARQDMERYRQEMDDYHKNLALKTRQEREETARTLHEIKVRQSLLEVPNIEMSGSLDFPSLGSRMAPSSLQDPLMGYQLSGLQPYGSGSMQTSQMGAQQQFTGSHYLPLQHLPQAPFASGQMQIGSNQGVDPNYAGLGMPSYFQSPLLGGQFGPPNTFLNPELLAQSRMNLLGVVPPNVQHDWLIQAAEENARRNMGPSMGINTITSMGIMFPGSDLGAVDLPSSTTATRAELMGRDDGSSSASQSQQHQHHGGARRDPSQHSARDPSNFDRHFY